MDGWQLNQAGQEPGFHTWRGIAFFTVRNDTSKSLKMPLDAESNGEQLRYYGSTPDSKGNDVKMASEVHGGGIFRL
jgi:hypothetical protein